MRGVSMALIVFAPSTARSQLSPGELHKSHAFLEGVQSCNKCHGTDRKLVADKCLACHAIITVQIGAGTGLHGKQRYNECQLCHVEHQGRDFALVYWKGGENSFDHALTGYRLEGKHATLPCRTCHRPENIRDASGLASEKVSLSRTYHGLEQECESCHADEHRGQLAQKCSECHTQAAWKPAPGFDHRKARFALTGAHSRILCSKCHLTLFDKPTPKDREYLKFTGIQHDQCTVCHADAHKGKLGTNCEGCHNTESWTVSDKANFDHTRTRYPLEGKHVRVACDDCHVPGRALRFGTCRDCHNDFHRGDFARRPSKGACEECHTVAGYKPARFVMSQHDSTAYPLRGAHRAVPCLPCHLVKSHPGAEPSYKFAFASTKCTVCHADPHRGELKQFVDKDGCEHCHVEDAWSFVKFDHTATKFALEGRHASVDCRKCHAARTLDFGQLTLSFVRTASRCNECHEDVHRAQFVNAATNRTDCERCHSAQSWKAERFDHNRDARFKLDGAHRKVPCKLCHVPGTVDGKLFVAYRPLDSSCKSCHSGSDALEGKSTQ